MRAWKAMMQPERQTTMSSHMQGVPRKRHHRSLTKQTYSFLCWQSHTTQMAGKAPMVLPLLTTWKGSSGWSEAWGPLVLPFLSCYSPSLTTVAASSKYSPLSSMACEASSHYTDCLRPETLLLSISCSRTACVARLITKLHTKQLAGWVGSAIPRTCHEGLLACRCM